jgi:putative glutathione S-transferase
MSQESSNGPQAMTATDNTDANTGHGTRGAYVTGGAEFNRDTNYIEDRITRDGRPGANGEPGWPVEAGRYRLIAARACPWANRTVIVRRLLGLEDAISLGQPGPTHDVRSWTFDLDPGGVDPVLGIERIQSAYLRRFPDYARGITVPAIVDVASGAVVTNNFPPDHLGLCHRMDPVPPTRSAGPLPGTPPHRN